MSFPNYVFFDTEFIERGHKYPIDLLSIGMVGGDGKTYYAQVLDVSWANASQWVVDNVIAKFDTCMTNDVVADHRIHVNTRAVAYYEQREPIPCPNPACPWKMRKEIAQDVIRIYPPESKPQFWAYYADSDWVLFYQLFGSMLEMPAGYPHLCMDIKQLQIHMGVPSLPPQDESEEHNALADAQWNLKAFRHIYEKAGGGK